MLLPQDNEYEDLKAVMSSYLFHGKATPKLLVQNGKLKPEALVTKCKLSLCTPCFKRTSRLEVSETKISSANGSHVSLGNSQSGLGSASEECSSASHNANNGSTALRNEADVGELKLAPINSSPNHKQQQRKRSNISSLNNDITRIPQTATNSKCLDVKRPLSVISETESFYSDNRCTVEGECKPNRKIAFSGTATGISATGSPAGSVGPLRRPNSQEMMPKHSEEELSRRKGIRKRISQLTIDPLFELSITLCILLNTLFLSLEYYGMNDDFRLALVIGNMVSLMLENCNLSNGTNDSE